MTAAADLQTQEETRGGSSKRVLVWKDGGSGMSEGTTCLLCKQKEQRDTPFHRWREEKSKMSEKPGLNNEKQ